MSPNELELKTEFKIVLYWIRGLAATSSNGECSCGAVFCISDTCMTTPRRKHILKEAPDWVKEKFPQYDFSQSKLKESNG